MAGNFKAEKYYNGMACIILWSRLKARAPHCGTTTLPRLESLSRWFSPKSSDNQVAIGCRFSWLNSGSRNSAKSLISRSWLDLSRAANQFLGSNLKTNHQVKKHCPSKGRFDLLGVPGKTHARDGLANQPLAYWLWPNAMWAPLLHTPAHLQSKTIWTWQGFVRFGTKIKIDAAKTRSWRMYFTISRISSYKQKFICDCFWWFHTFGPSSGGYWQRSPATSTA